MSLFPPYDRRAARRAAPLPASLPAPVGAVHPAAGDGDAVVGVVAPDVAAADAAALGEPDAASPAATAAGASSNCGAPRIGEFCAHCGQHFLEDRLSFRLLAAELWERMTFERGWLRTFREMMLDPGGVVTRYVQGQRRRYISPLTYLLVGAALSLLLFQLYEAQMVAWMQAQTAGLTLHDHPYFTARQVELHTEIMSAVVRQTTYTALAMCAMFALAMRLFFRRSGINLVESFVFSLFTFGHVYYVAAPLTALLMLTVGSVTATMWVTFPLYLVVCGLAAAQYFGRPVRSVIKTAAALVSSYFVFSFVLSVSIFVFVLLSVREGISAPRDTTPAAPAAPVAAPAPTR